MFNNEKRSPGLLITKGMFEQKQGDLLELGGALVPKLPGKNSLWTKFSSYDHFYHFRNNKPSLDYGQMAEEAFKSSFKPFRRVPLLGK